MPKELTPSASSRSRSSLPRLNLTSAVARARDVRLCFQTHENKRLRSVDHWGEPRNRHNGRQQRLGVDSAPYGAYSYGARHCSCLSSPRVHVGGSVCVTTLALFAREEGRLCRIPCAPPRKQWNRVCLSLYCHEIAVVLHDLTHVYGGQRGLSCHESHVDPDRGIPRARPGRGGSQRQGWVQPCSSVYDLQPWRAMFLNMNQPSSNSCFHLRVRTSLGHMGGGGEATGRARLVATFYQD